MRGGSCLRVVCARGESCEWGERDQSGEGEGNESFLGRERVKFAQFDVIGGRNGQCLSVPTVCLQ